MSLSVSPISNVSFGMAKFSREGKRLAEAAGAGDFNEYNNDKFYSKHTVIKPEFLKFAESKVPVKKKGIKKEQVQTVADSMVQHGTSGIDYVDALFIKNQALNRQTQVYLSKLAARNPEAYSSFVDAEKELFEANWNNPKLSKKDTKRLLQAIRPKMSDADYVRWSGIIDQSDAKEPKEVKVKGLRKISK